MVSARPIVSGDGPREEPTPTPAVRNSRLATLSARDIVAGDIRPRGEGPSPLRDGGLGITIEPVGVEDADCLGGNAGVMSPTSENRSPSERNKAGRSKAKELKREEEEEEGRGGGEGRGEGGGGGGGGGGGKVEARKSFSVLEDRGRRNGGTRMQSRSRLRDGSWRYG